MKIWKYLCIEIIIYFRDFLTSKEMLRVLIINWLLIKQSYKYSLCKYFSFLFQILSICFFILHL